MNNTSGIIGIIGAGSMGSGIAQLAAGHGHEVHIYESNPDQIVRAQAKLQKILARLVEKGRITDADAVAITGRHYFMDKLQDLSGCQLIIEAIIEDLAIKKKIFSELESYVSDGCILASNTSSLSITEIAAACKFPDRVLGIHFFNPAPVMKLVEIIPAIQTDPQITSYAVELISSWNKTVVEVKDTPGFIVNRVARPFYGEALRIYEEGIADIPTIDWAMTEIGQFKMGPFTLMDYIGNDVNYKVTESVFKAFYYDPRYRPAFTQQRLAQAGYLGRKSGRGYYNYAEGHTTPPATEDNTLGQQIVDRIVAMLINEAADALYLRIASRDDLDLAMTRGVNYPKGLLQWADDIGIDHCVERMDNLYNRYHEDRYRCSPLLRDMATSDSRFYSDRA